MLRWLHTSKKSETSRHHSFRKTSCGAQVAPQRCPILRMSKSIIMITYYFQVSIFATALFTVGFALFYRELCIDFPFDPHYFSAQSALFNRYIQLVKKKAKSSI